MIKYFISKGIKIKNCVFFCPVNKDIFEYAGAGICRRHINAVSKKKAKKGLIKMQIISWPHIRHTILDAQCLENFQQPGLSAKCICILCLIYRD